MLDSAPQNPPPQIVDYKSSQVAGPKSWWQVAFSRGNIFDVVKTIAWVVPLTILIWVYAEREQVDRVEKQPIPIDVRSSDPNRVAKLIAPDDKNIWAELSGPRAKLEIVRDSLTAGPGRLLIDIEPNLPTGVQQIATVQALRNIPIFRENGISVSNCLPARLQIEVDELVDRDLDVGIPPSVNNLVGTPLFEPRKVRVRGPKSVLETAASQGKLNVYADIGSLDVVKIPGRHELPAVPITISLRDEHITLSPTTVKASFDVKQSNITYPIGSMAIFVVAPPSLLDKYKVVVNNNNPILSNITVIGPQEKIALLDQNNITPKPRATLEVTREDLPAGETRLRRLKFELPEGITVSPEDAKREVEFKLVDRTAPE